MSSTACDEGNEDETKDETGACEGVLLRRDVMFCYMLNSNVFNHNKRYNPFSAKFYAAAPTPFTTGGDSAYLLTLKLLENITLHVA